MKFKAKTILLISPEPWNHIFVSKHHYATHLASRGNRVFFLNPPSRENKIEQTGYLNLWSVHYKRFPRGMRFYPDFLQRRITKNKFRFLQKLCNVEFDLVWSFDNSVFYDFKALPENVFCISHIVDLNQDFQTEKAAKTAHLCIGVVPQLVERLGKFNSNTYLITHGVQEFPENPEPKKLPGDNKIKALYVGNMTMPQIDWQLFFSIASLHSFVDFIFLGPNWPENINHYKIQLEQLANIYHIDAVPASELPSYLNSATLLFLAYTPDYIATYASPHKLMEYLASGKMFITTHLPDYQHLVDAGLIAMPKNDLLYIEEFKSVIKNLAYWNSESLTKVRKQYASQHSYQAKIEQIEKILQAKEN